MVKTLRRSSEPYISGADSTPACEAIRTPEPMLSLPAGGIVRRLKLQMQITVDGFVAGPEGQLDWMTWEMDEKLIAFINHLTDTSDTILLGRKMTEGFIKYWEHVITQPKSPEYEFGQKMVRMPKIVFSKTVKKVEGQNVRVENGPIVDAVNRL